MTDTEKRQRALKEFNLRDQSAFWSKSRQSVRTCRLAKHVGVSKSTIQEWYGRWRADNNTGLSDRPQIDRKTARLSKEEYFAELDNGSKITSLEAAIKYGTSKSNLKNWRREYKKINHPDQVEEKSNIGKGESKVTATEQQKKMVLREFNLKEKSHYWDKVLGTVKMNELSKIVGVSYCTVFDWYSRWKADNNTNLERIQNNSKKEMEDKKYNYFLDLQDGKAGTSHADARRTGVTVGTIKRWRKEFKEKSGQTLWRTRRKKNKRKSTKIVVEQTQTEAPVQLENTEPVVVVDEAKAPAISPPVDPQNNGHSDVETLDNFFDGMIKMQEKLSQLEEENKRIPVLEKELKSYKERLQKWASQVVTLQNALVVKG
jgi:transposase